MYNVYAEGAMRHLDPMLSHLSLPAPTTQYAYPHHMSIATVYSSTRQDPVSTTCRRRRLLWLSHVVRDGPNSASYQALEMAINTRDIKRPRGRPHLRWIDNIKNDVKHANIDISDCFELALDKKKWLMLVEKCAALA